MNIYVGNLSYDVVEEDLREIFEEYGEVSSIKIIADKYTGRSKGFGFIEMPDKKEAISAIQELNNATLDNRPMKVNEAKQRDDNNQGRRNFKKY
jgi:RNA recognition motif-containing protein